MHYDGKAFLRNKFLIYECGPLTGTDSGPRSLTCFPVQTYSILSIQKRRRAQKWTRVRLHINPIRRDCGSQTYGFVSEK